jgi:polo-like kinase 1
VKTTYKNIRTLNYSFPDGVEISPHAKNLIQRILQSQPECRPLLAEIENDVWFHQIKVSKTAPFSLFPYSAVVPSGLPVVHEARERERDPLKTMKRVDSVGAPLHSREPLRPLNIVSDAPGRPSPRFASASPRFRMTENNTKPLKQPSVPAEVRKPLATVANTENIGFNHLQPQAAQWAERFPAASPLPEEPVLIPSSTKSAASSTFRCPSPRAMEIQTTPVSCPRLSRHSVWATEYSDFSSKYGLAYKLNCGLTGAVFNDSTKIIWDDTTGRVEYFSRVVEKEAGTNPPPSGNRPSEERLICTVTDYPEILKKKITLIMYFRSYFAKYKGKPGAAYPIITTNPNTVAPFGSEENCAVSSSSLSSPKEDLVYVRQWMKDDNAIVFRLSNRCYQVSFLDGTDLLMNSELKLVTHTDAITAKMTTFSLQTGQCPTPEIAEKYDYMQKLLHQFMHKNQS